MLKRMSFLIWIGALCCIAISVLGTRFSLLSLKNSENIKYMFTGKILSYDYSQYNKYASYYFSVDVNGELIDLEIPNLYVSKFKRKEFEKKYSSNDIYEFVVFEKDYYEYDIIPVVGIKNHSDVLLDENIVLEINSFNSKMGIIFSALFFVIGLIIIFLKCITMLKSRFT